MARLIWDHPESENLGSIGGIPLGDAGTAWPKCRTCGSSMQFIAQLLLSDAGVESLKGRPQVLRLCQAEPGMCDEWDANAGGNEAQLVSTVALVPQEPPSGETLLPDKSKLGFEDYDDTAAVETQDDAYCSALDRSTVLGKVGGGHAGFKGTRHPLVRAG